MSRQARKRSPSGIYHVMTRGINKMDLFHDDKDRYKYCDILRKVKEKYKFRLYAYCLMTNHVHILAEEDEYPISEVMKSIGVRYSMYFNKKNQRIGMLFQNRFRSEAVDSENQFLTCARYIHNNPVKAGMVKSPERYPWSSFQGYLGLTANLILDSDLLLGYYQQDKILLRNFTCEESNDNFMDFDRIHVVERVDVEDLCALVKLQFGLELAEIKELDRSRQKTVLKTIKANTVLSYRSLAEVIGVSKDVIYRA